MAVAGIGSAARAFQIVSFVECAMRDYVEEVRPELADAATPEKICAALERLMDEVGKDVFRTGQREKLLQSLGRVDLLPLNFHPPRPLDALTFFQLYSVVAHVGRDPRGAPGLFRVIEKSLDTVEDYRNVIAHGRPLAVRSLSFLEERAQHVLTELGSAGAARARGHWLTSWFRRDLGWDEVLSLVTRGMEASVDYGDLEVPPAGRFRCLVRDDVSVRFPGGLYRNRRGDLVSMSPAKVARRAGSSLQSGARLPTRNELTCWLEPELARARSAGDSIVTPSGLEFREGEWELDAENGGFTPAGSTGAGFEQSAVGYEGSVRRAVIPVTG